MELSFFAQKKKKECGADDALIFLTLVMNVGNFSVFLCVT